jgi:hypothetical protein
MRRLLPFVTLVLTSMIAHAACNTGSAASSTIDDAGDDAASPADGGDSGCPTPRTMPATGETCTGFGKESPCEPACGLPAYGYVCFNGGPPGFNGCVQVRSSSLGETYCCPHNDCVAEPDQDKQCSGVSGKPHLYQCPPSDVDGGAVAPPSGSCASKSIGGSRYAYYCCP